MLYLRMAVAESQARPSLPNDLQTYLNPSVFSPRASETRYYSRIGGRIENHGIKNASDFFPGFRPEIEIHEVICASDSPKRRGFLESAFQNIAAVKTHPGGEEPKIPEVGIIARKKVEYVLGLLNLQEAKNTAVFAGDTRTKLQQVGADGRIRLESKGKPESYSELFNNFQGMAQAVNNNITPYYVIESGSASHIIHREENLHFLDREACIIELNPRSVLRLATKEGFYEYLAQFSDFYLSAPYNELHNSKVTPLDLCGGLSLSVLVKMGAVMRINGISINNPQFPEVLQKGLHIALVGISPMVLRPIHPNPEAAVTNWEWLTKVRNHVLNPNMLQ